MKISTVEQMRNLDKSAIADYGISQELLMENAGEAVYYVILREYGIQNKRFAVFCGTGNNGGDGLVAARKIHSSGGEPWIFRGLGSSGQGRRWNHCPGYTGLSSRCSQTVQRRL